jgi:hypothetical protein
MRHAERLPVSFSKEIAPIPDTFSVTVHHGAYLLVVASGAATMSDLRNVLRLTGAAIEARLSIGERW